MLHPERITMRRAGLSVLAAVLLAALLIGCGKKNETGFPGEGKGDVIATYKGGQVTQGEFDKYTAFMEVTDPQTAMYLQIPQFKEKFLREFVLYKALAGRASVQQLKAADEDTGKFTSQFGDAVKKNAQLNDLLKQKNLTQGEIKRIVKMLASGNQIPKAKHTEYTNAVTEGDIKAEFDKRAADYNIVTVRHILIATVDPQTQKQLKTDEEALKLAKEVKDRLDHGGDWNTLAKQYSDDPGSKENGGLYEKKQAKGWAGGFKDAANTQEIGKVGEPVKTEFGYHVMKVESRQPTPFDKLTQAEKDELKQDVVGAKVEKFLEDEQKALDIKVNLPAEPSPAPSASPSASAPASPPLVPSGTPSASPSAAPSASSKL